MDYPMDWLPSEVCDDFANCDINTVDGCNLESNVHTNLTDSTLVASKSSNDSSMFQNTGIGFMPDFYGAPQSTSGAPEGTTGASQYTSGNSQCTAGTPHSTSSALQSVNLDQSTEKSEDWGASQAKKYCAEFNNTDKRYQVADSCSKDITDVSFLCNFFYNSS